MQEMAENMKDEGAGADPEREREPPPGPSGRGPRLPWEDLPREHRHAARELRYRCLKLSHSEAVFLEDTEASVALQGQGILQASAIVERAGAALEADERLRKRRFELVPRRATEEEFWARYFSACERAKNDLLAPSAADPGKRGLARAPSPVLIHSRTGTREIHLQHGHVLSSVQLRKLGDALITARTVASLAELERGPASGLPTPAAGGGTAIDRAKRAMAAGKTALTKVMSGDQTELLSNAVWEMFDPEAPDGPTLRGGAGASTSSSRGGRGGGTLAAKLARDLGGAPPYSLLAFLAQHMSDLHTMSQMARLWSECVKEITWHWRELRPIPRLPAEQAPDLSYCPLMQKLQLINCCISRRRRLREHRERFAAAAPADSARCPPARTPRGGLEERVAALAPVEGPDGQPKLLLQTREPMFEPLTQELPVFTEETMRETNEMVIKTGSVGAGVQQLLGDMQAFKAANPGCTLPDFVRWYSPADWVRKDPLGRPVDDEALGTLSVRMREEDNMWEELFERANPVPAYDQVPLFDAEHVGGEALESLGQIAPSDLFEQIFAAAVSLEHLSVETVIDILTEGDRSSNLFRTMMDTAAYANRLFVRGLSASKIDTICETYKALEELIAFTDEEFVGGEAATSDVPSPGPGDGDGRSGDWTML